MTFKVAPRPNSDDFDVICEVNFETGAVRIPEGQMDFDSDEPLVCPLDKKDDQTCESCQ